MNKRSVLILVVLTSAALGCGIKEGWISNPSGSYFFAPAALNNSMLGVKIKDRQMREKTVATKASIYQKYDAVWLDDDMILVASSDIGFFAVDVLGRCMNADVCKLEDEKYVVRILNERQEQIKAIVLKRGAMPRTSLLKYVDYRGGKEI